MCVLRERILALVFSLAVLAVAIASPAHAQGFEGALAGFTADSFNDTDTAIAAVASSGNTQALPVIQALQDGRLLFSATEKKVFIRDKAGATLDAASGQPASAAPSDLKPVRLNNRVRRSIDAALGGLTLLAPEPQKRYEAAQAVFKSRDQTALATLDTAIGKETDDPRQAHADGGARRRHPQSRGRQGGGQARRRRRPSATAATRTRSACSAACRPTRRRPSARLPPTPSRRSRQTSPCGTPRRTPGTGCRSARCCCSPRSGLPSRSA